MFFIEIIKIGNKNPDFQYDFRETCFGICYIDGKLCLTKKDGEIYLPGGGIEKGENHIECLKREFLEEIGCEIVKAKRLCDIDCYWFTRNEKHMESLTHIYIVEISDIFYTPLESKSEIVRLTIDEARLFLELPYQQKALDVFINKLNR